MKTWAQLGAMAHRDGMSLFPQNPKPGGSVSICTVTQYPLVMIITEIKDRKTADRVTRRACEAALCELKGFEQ